MKNFSGSFGYITVLTATFLWAISGTSGKYLFERGLTPQELVQLRLSISVVLLFVFLYLKSRSLLKVAKKDIFYFALLGMVGMGMVQFTYFYAISKIKVAVAILLEYLAPSFITLYSMIFLKERPGFFVIASLLGATAGCYLVVGAYNVDILSMNKEGIIGGLGAALSFAFYSVYGEKGMKKYNPWIVLFYAILFASILWNIIHPPFKAFAKSYSFIEWMLIFYIALFGTIIPFRLYLEGIKRIGATRASVTAIMEPIFAGFISWIVLTETFEMIQIFGGILVITSIIVLQLRKEAKA